MNFKNEINSYLRELVDTIQKLDADEIDKVMNVLAEQRQTKGNIYIFGNGGSAATASHVVCDFNKGISENLTSKFNFICLNDNVPTLMAIANDISFDDVFSFQLEGRLNPADMVIAISGSGNSKNVIKAVEFAKTLGCVVIGITGYDGGKLKSLSDYRLHVPINDMQKVEDIHLVFDHMIMQIFIQHLN